MHKFILYIVLFWGAIGSAKVLAEDTIPRKLIIGVDLVGPIKVAFDNNRQMGEISLSYGSYKNFYFSGEFGMMKIDETKPLYTYIANGNFFRLGFDYNIFNKNLPWENNRILVGMRYGVANFTHEAANITIEDKIWGNFTTHFASTPVSAQWLEARFGVKAQIISRLSMGWVVHLRVQTTNSGMKNVKPAYIPGFGSGASNKAIGFTYSIYYELPLFN